MLALEDVAAVVRNLMTVQPTPELRAAALVHLVTRKVERRRSMITCWGIKGSRGLSAQVVLRGGG